MRDGSASTPVSQSVVVAPGKPLSWLHALLCSGHVARQFLKDALLVTQPGNHLVTCRGNVLPLLLLWCSEKGAYSSDYFLPPQKLSVLHVAGTAKARDAATAHVSHTDTAGGHGEELDGAALGHGRGTHTKTVLQQASAIWLLQGCKGEQLKLSKLNRFEMKHFFNRESNKPWEQIIADEMSLLPPLENVNKYWVSFWNICPASFQLLQVLWLGSIDINDGGGSFSFAISTVIQQWAEQPLSALTIDRSVSPMTPISYQPRLRPVSCSSNIIFPDTRNEWITAVCVGRKSGMAAAELMSEAVGAASQMSTLPCSWGPLWATSKHSGLAEAPEVCLQSPASARLRPKGRHFVGFQITPHDRWWWFA